MNAQPHAVALGTAHAIALASFAGSVSAKRRERKGPHRTAPQGNHSFWSPSIHSVTQVTREATPEQSVTPSDAWMEEIDFEAEVPCLIDEGEHAADLMIRTVCVGCRNQHVYGICRDRWAWMGEHQFKCSKCGSGEQCRDDFAAIVEVLR